MQVQTQPPWPALDSYLIFPIMDIQIHITTKYTILSKVICCCTVTRASHFIDGDYGVAVVLPMLGLLSCSSRFPSRFPRRPLQCQRLFRELVGREAKSIHCRIYGHILVRVLHGTKIGIKGRGRCIWLLKWLKPLNRLWQNQFQTQIAASNLVESMR
jgi:hypothetical protein